MSPEPYYQDGAVTTGGKQLTMCDTQPAPLAVALDAMEARFTRDTNDVDFDCLQTMMADGLALVKACRAVMACPTDEYVHSEAERRAHDRGVLDAQDWLRAVVNTAVAT